MKKRMLETAIQEVTRGYEITTQLRSLLEQLQPRQQVGLGSELGFLSEQLLQALTASLSILNSGVADEDGGSPEGNQQHRRRNNRRHQQSWTEITPELQDDGHQWRKYGQKPIHNSKYPRSYYRCTHKDGQSCPATKQVQQRDYEDRPMFLVTYINNHTCCNTTTPTTSTPQLSVDPTPPSTDQPFSITFGSNTKQEQPPLSQITLECSGQMDSWQLGTCPSSSNHPVLLDQPKHGSMAVHQEPLSFTTEEVGGGGDINYFSGSWPSPRSQGCDIMDYLLMDTSGYEFMNDVKPFLN